MYIIVVYAFSYQIRLLLLSYEYIEPLFNLMQRKICPYADSSIRMTSSNAKCIETSKMHDERTARITQRSGLRATTTIICIKSNFRIQLSWLQINAHSNALSIHCIVTYGIENELSKNRNEHQIVQPNRSVNCKLQTTNDDGVTETDTAV